MPIGVGAAMLIGSAVAGGTAVAGAKIQSNAANKAREQQQAATNQALAVQQEQNAPYLQVGQQAAARLASGQAMGKPYTQQFGGPGGSNGFQAFNPQPPPQQGPPQGTLSSLGQPPQGQMPMGPQQQMPPPQGPPQGQQGGGMVKLQAPDGSMSQVPEAMAQQFIQRGARRIG